ncbi:hypothetical protein [Robiginitalea biformata]|uniref:Uncharacterized protein n=1 Tax=Robiginitalea biformata (strain ATCC BAA-864 / DSM 15991 / KCTC 12146 / HTCC2501) TaxID=313596 RepID=A4CP46_ROBBH|nr:hypothetical protein [Robiginitalea biformata]EAR14663.1 hypothetical protein RB2501_01266 [Robiginitalea biformata HTCC2501]
MIPFALPPDYRKRILRFAKDVGIYVSLLFASFKAFRNDTLRVQAQAQKDVLDERLEARTRQVDSLRTENYLLDARIKNVLSRIVNDSRDLDDLPFPVWIKLYDPLSRNFKRVYFNKAYERKYDTDRIATLGRVDKEEVAPEIAASWHKSDWAAYRSRTPIEADDLTPGGGSVPVVKWRNDEGGLTYIYGMDLSKDDWEL